MMGGKKWRIILPLIFCVVFLAIGSIFYSDTRISPKSIYDAIAEDYDYSVSPGNVTGYAWNSNFGWMSFNSLNCDPDYDGQFEAGGPAGCPTTGASPNYGVNVEMNRSANKGVMSGYAWASNIGWLSFYGKYCANDQHIQCDKDSDCPTGTCAKILGNPPQEINFENKCNNKCKFDDSVNGCIACYDLDDKKVYGWAVWINKNGGYQWIRLDDANLADGDHGVRFVPESNFFNGWAWGGEADGTGLGWVSFNSGNAEDGNSGAAYAVNLDVIMFDNALNLAGLGSKIDDHCARVAGFESVKSLRLGWKYNGQTKYEVALTTQGFNPVTELPGKIAGNDPAIVIHDSENGPLGSNQYYLPDPGAVQYGQTYYYYVKAWRGNVQTDWQQYYDEADPDQDGDPATFTVYRNELPRTGSIALTPPVPSEGEETYFTATGSKYYENGTANDCSSAECQHEWIIQSSNPHRFKDGYSSTGTSTIATFGQGITTVYMKLTDLSPADPMDYPYQCTSTAASFNPVKKKLPNWREKGTN